MTLKELLENEPHLTTDDEQTGIYLIPNGKFGFTSFPVGAHVETMEDVPNELPEDFVLPDEDQLTDEEKYNLLYHKEVKRTFELDKAVVLVTVEQYQGLMQRTHCWQDGKCVAYVEPKEVTEARELLEEYNNTLQQKAEAEQWLHEHDYIGVKIAEAMLVGTDEEIIGLKKQYEATISEAKAKRLVVNQCESALIQLQANIEHAQEVLTNEN